MGRLTRVRRALFAVAMLAFGGLSPAAAAEDGLAQAFLITGGQARPPIGWVEFCEGHRSDCGETLLEPRDIVLTKSSWRDLNRLNRLVNARIQPATDQEIYGVAERWTYPQERGDCEDYVLLKRKLLMEAGWPRQALLITVVRDQRDDGHAVLTVKTDRGEFVLDNQTDEILLWSETGYRFVKRQSQADQNAWTSLGDTRAGVGITATRSVASRLR